MPPPNKFLLSTICAADISCNARALNLIGHRGAPEPSPSSNTPEVGTHTPKSAKPAEDISSRILLSAIYRSCEASSHNSAASAVGNLVEIMDIIFSFLPTIDILRLRAVCRLWGRMITSSIVVQRALWTKPSRTRRLPIVQVPSTPRYFAQVFKQGRHELVGPLRKPVNKPPFLPVFVEVQWHPLIQIFTQTAYSWRSESIVAMEMKESVVRRLLEAPTGLWEDMLVAQPPVANVRIIGDPWMVLGRDGEVGITMGQLRGFLRLCMQPDGRGVSKAALRLEQLLTFGAITFST